MKAEILKLAGVKNEQEFYKKFPTEGAFIKKHGKELKKLKKAKMGDIISGGDTSTASYSPISYSDLYDDTTSAITGVSKQEKARQEGLASQQAIANASGQKGGGIADILGGIDPSMIASLVGGAKNGKKLNKAVDGFMGKPFQGMPSSNFNVSSNSGFNTNVASNPYMSGSLIGGQKAQASSGSWAANPYLDSPFKSPATNSMSGSGFDWKGTLGKISPALAMQAGPLIGAYQDIMQGREDLKREQMYGDVSDVVLQASNSTEELSPRRYIRPEDRLTSSMNPLGTGTNYLSAKNGAEIQNTYAPDVLYSDLGYEPLNDSNKMKQYKKGGKMKKAAGGINLDPFAGIAGSLGGALGSATKKGSGKGGPGSTIGSTIGGIAGSFIPIPGVGTALGSLAGGFIGGLFDGNSQNKMQAAVDKRNNNMFASSFGQGARNIQKRNKPFMKDGGWVSNDWQPQVIASFGEHSMEDLLAPDPMMDTLRAGGHLSYYTPPSERAMSTERAENGIQMAMGGDLQVHRGKAEPISYNPFLPNNGETVMFRGPSHDDGGMPISYGQNGVEVEGGEPAQVMEDGGKQDNLVVFGNMVIPDYGANEIGDSKAKGMKFKRYIADLSKQETKNNKYMDKSLDLINSADTNDPFEQLSFNSGKAMMLGSQMNLKNIADKKKNAAVVQDAILETAEEQGIDSAKLAKQKIAKFGGKFTSAPIAKDGINMEDLIPEIRKSSYIPNLSKQITDARSAAKIADEARRGNGFNIANYIPGKLFHQGIPYQDNIGVFDPEIGQYIAPELANVTVNAKRLKNEIPSNSMLQGNIFNTEEQSNEGNPFPWENIIKMGLSSAAPLLRSQYDDQVSGDQLAPEMLASALNQLEPVQAQLYNPMLTQATSISLQDQLNEVTAQTRAAERFAQGDPSALAMIAAQGQQAKSKILGEQFRMNQAEKQRVAEQNAAVLNDAQLKNLALLDQQYVRQSEGRSKTKTQAIEISKAIADKIAKKKSENLTANLYQNMYPDFNITSSGAAYKNPYSVASFGPGMGRGSSQGRLGGANIDTSKLMPTNYDDYGNPTNFKVIGSKNTDKDIVSKNGAIVRAIKNL
jgi:hypothetical protein